MLVLSEERPVEIDAVEFEEAAEAARAAGTIEAYGDALALYGGELLPEDRYEDWAAGRREALRELHLTLLLELAEHHAAAGDAAGAIEALQRAVVDDPLHEEAHRRLMRLFAEVGRRQQALAQYQQLGQPPRREYAADASPEARRLLLLLDSCEHLVGACARLAEELLTACSQLTILATSREPLHIGGEVTVRVPSLGLPDPELKASVPELMGFESIRLFAERAA